MDPTERPAEPPVDAMAATAATATPDSDACASEARELCASDVELLTLLELSKHHNEDKITQVRQRLRDCLIEHAEQLAPPCVHALVDGAATAQSVVPLPLPPSNDSGLAPREHNDGAVVIPHNSIRSGDAPPQDESAVEVRIFLINHHGPAAVAAPRTSYIRVGGDAAQFADHSSGSGAVAASGMSVPLWVGLVMLPFLCVGLVASFRHLSTFLRRRRDVVYRVGTTQQYMPIRSGSKSLGT
ncbi:hypothetical protein PINS_up011947 [Pythium insidiosum]|nr:hypothetical protein PINS_up011947 [Pythium insidiosum]